MLAVADEDGSFLKRDMDSSEAHRTYLTFEDAMEDDIVPEST